MQLFLFYDTVTICLRFGLQMNPGESGLVAVPFCVLESGVLLQDLVLC